MAACLACILAAATSVALSSALSTQNHAPCKKVGRMRAVFLDVDGVLLPFGDPGEAEEQEEHACERGKGRFPDRCLKVLSKILSQTGAVVVLSSTWRCAGGSEAIIEEFRQFSLRENARCPLGIIAEKGDFEYITDPNMHSHRQWEIAAWLDWAEQEGVEVESWCALDDEELVSEDTSEGGGDFNARLQQMFAGRHIKTPSNVGLTDEHATRAIAALLRCISREKN